MVLLSTLKERSAINPNPERMKLSALKELHNLENKEPIESKTSELQTSEKRGVLGNVKYFLGEGILKPIARGVELAPAGFESIIQTGLDNVRNIAGKQLKEDGAVFGATVEEFQARTPEQKRRVALNNRIVQNMDKSIETSKRLQQNWIDATQTGIEAPSEEFLKSSPIPFTKDFSFTRMFALGAQSVPMLGLAATVTAATKSPIAGASILGVIEASEEFNIAREKGLTVEEANRVFISNAIVLSALESVPLTSFMKGGALPVRMFRTASQEGLEEVLQKLWRDSVAKLGYDETRSLTEGLIENFLGGFISGGVIGGFGPSGNIQRRIKNARDKGVDTDKMMEVAAEQVIDNAEEITDKFSEKASPESIDRAREGVKPSRRPGEPVLDEKGKPITIGIEKAGEFEVEAELLRGNKRLVRTEGDLLHRIIVDADGNFKKGWKYKTGERGGVKYEIRVEVDEAGNPIGKFEIRWKSGEYTSPWTSTGLKTFENAEKVARIEVEAFETFEEEGVEPAVEEVEQVGTIPKETKLGAFVDRKLQEEIDKEQRRLDKLEILEFEKQHVDNIINEMKGRINKKKDPTVAEEISPIPARFATTNKFGLSADEALDEFVTRGFLPEESTVSDLVEFLVDTNEQSKRIAEEISDLKPKIIAQRETTILKNKIKNIKRGFKRGQVVTKEVIRDRINAINELLADLELRDKGKFIKTPKKITEGDIDNEQKFEQLLSDISERVGRLKEQAERRSLKSKITSNLKRSRPKLSSKKLKGKFTPKIQEILDNVRGYSKLNQTQAADLLGRRLSSDIVGTPQDAFENKFLAYQSGDPNVTLQDIQELNDQIEALMVVGRKINVAQLLAKQEVIEGLKLEGNEALDKKRDIKAEGKVGFAAVVRDIPKALRSLLQEMVANWNGVLDVIFPESLASKLEVGEELEKEAGIKRKWNERFLKDAKDAFELKDERAVTRKFDEDGKIHNLGIFKNVNGEQVTLKVSVSQVRKLWMESLDPTLTETLTHKKGNAYTRGMFNAMFGLLTINDVVFAKKQIKAYAEFFPEINAVYSKVFGINLRRNLFYSPIRRESDAGDLQVDEFLRDQQYRAQVSSSALKIRDPRAIAPLELRSDIQVYKRHITEMSRFIALREKMQVLTSFFGDKDISRKIKTIYGKEAFNIINRHIDSFIRGGIQSANFFDKIVNELNRNYSVSQLQGKGKIGLTQLVSYFAFAETIPVGDFVSGSRDFFSNFEEAVNILGNTEFLRNRGFNPEVDIQRMGQVFDSAMLNKWRRRKESMHDYLLIFTRLGDRAPIYVGGWAVYKSVLKQTGSKEKAISAFIRQSKETQQDPALDQTSLIQKGNPILRGLAMFMSAPIAQFRGETRAMRKLSKGEINKRQFLKSMLIYHFIIPQLYQLVANAFVWDEDDQWRAAVLGSLNGIPLLGDMMNRAFRRVQKKRAFEGDSLKWARPTGEITAASFEALAETLEGDFEDAAEAIIDAAKPIGEVTGFPSSQTENLIKAQKDINNGRPLRGTVRFLGWPESVAKKIKD